MPSSKRRRTLLHSLAVICAWLVFAICLLSAYIRLTQAGLGCGDWPQCYGSRLSAAAAPSGVVPPDTLAVRTVRMSHRVVASVALLVVLALVWLAVALRPRLRREAALAVALLLLALALALLGRHTSGARVPAVAVGNLIGGALMLAAACRLVVQTGRAGAVGDARLRVLAVVAALALLTQLVLGGLVSASFAGLSCTGVADCVQQARTAQWPWLALDPWREPHFAASASVPVHPVGALAQLVHRAGAVLVVPLLLALGWRALGGPCHRTGVVLLGALVLQLVIGVAMVALALPLPLALAHNLVALLLLVLVVRLI